MLQCQKTVCPNAATHALQLGVPCITDPDDAPPRVKILMGVLVCEECLDDETAERWLDINGDTLRPVVNIAMGEGAVADFTRAVVLGVPIQSPEYQNLVLQGLDRKPN